jgi:hypothetical protein
MRFAVLCLISACTQHPIARPPAPKPRPPEPPRLPGARLHEAVQHGKSFDVPTHWLENHPSHERVFASPAYGLEERWTNGTVCREAFYASDVPEHDDATWRSLVSSLNGDDQYREAKLEVEGLRLHLKRERYCIYHNCKPPLSPPMTALTVCDDRATFDLALVGRTLVHYMPSLDGHEPALSLAPLLTAKYSRQGNGRDEVEIAFTATAAQQDALRSFFVEHDFATRDPTLAWAINSKHPRRSYLFSPSEGAIASLKGWTK